MISLSFRSSSLTEKHKIVDFLSLVKIDFKHLYFFIIRVSLKSTSTPGNDSSCFRRTDLVICLADVEHIPLMPRTSNIRGKLYSTGYMKVAQK